MKILSIEHSKFAYWADFAVYGAGIAVLPWVLFDLAPPPFRARMAMAVLAGAMSWSLVEYGMHRLVFHGVEPFQRMHGQHHLRPQALVATPTVLSLAMIAGMFWLPASMLTNGWVGSAATLGLTAGYLVYGVVHHALHHGLARSAWMRRRKHLHALHHRAPRLNYGVTMSWWDRVFRTFEAP
jgi:sterol desaturase/sphingolipid hydroxylase (fatty acid hydroxylase superfamily)